MKKLIFFAILLFIVLAVFAVLSELSQLSGHAQNIKNLVVLNYTLPRIGVALLSGAFLAVASALMAQITHNPLASDSTLGVGSGAGFMLLFGALFLPNFGIDGVASAFLGALAALGILFALSHSRGFSVFTTTLSGLIIGIFFSSLTTLLMLFFQEQSYFLAIWMSGDLAQDSALNFRQMAGLFVPALAAIAYFSRSFGAFVLGDSACKALGVNVTLTRVTGLIIAAYLTAVVVAFVGVIAFVGLAACTLTGRFKFKNFASKLAVCALVGALMLAITDEILIIILNLSGLNLPAGSVSAFLGAPLLIWLIFFGIKRGESASRSDERALASKERGWLIWTLGVLALAVAAMSLFFGFSGFEAEILRLRGVRVLSALASGMILGVAGVLLQRLSQNNMASPELLGISSGVSLGVMAAIFLAPAMSVPFGLAGGCLVLGLMLALNYKSGMLPQKVILTGIAIMSFSGAVEKILLALGDSRIYSFLAYSSGSTYSLTMSWAVWLGVIALACVGFALCWTRQVALLGLGEASARSLGLDVGFYRGLLFLFCALASAAAALSIGPVSFVGLLAPHIALFLGFFRPKGQILAAAFTGAILMSVADFLGRTLLSPYEISSGLIATIIGSAYFVFAMKNMK